MNYKVLKALQEVDLLIVEEMEKRSGTATFLDAGNLEETRGIVQKAIACILEVGEEWQRVEIEEIIDSHELHPLGGIW